MKRTQQEIIERIEERKDDDLLGFEWQEYACYLDAEHVQPYLQSPDPEWEADAVEPTERMKEYMDFAWEKANNERGISANRSISHYIAWLWLAGEDDLLARVEAEYETNYHHYGKPILKLICEHFGWDWKSFDNGI